MRRASFYCHNCREFHGETLIPGKEEGWMLVRFRRCPACHEKEQLEKWGREVCPRCHAVAGNPTSTEWHWTGESWEHKCPDLPPQAGHFGAGKEKET